MVSETLQSNFLHSVGDTRMWQSNPVLCIERLLKTWENDDNFWIQRRRRLLAVIAELENQSIRLPQRVIERWVDEDLLTEDFLLNHRSEPLSPGVVGLVVDYDEQTALVVPLGVESASTWSVAANLPVKQGQLEELFARILPALELPHGKCVPERFAFSISENLGHPIDGPSMDVSALLAVVDCANEKPPILRCACAVVQFEADLLVPVGNAVEKLKAFVREFGRGSLLVRALGDLDSAAFDEHFDTVWEVQRFKQFAERISEAELLDTLFRDLPLTTSDLKVVNARVGHLAHEQHRYRDALDLAERIELCGYKAAVPLHDRREVKRIIIDLYRHLGEFEKAVSLAREEASRVRHSPVTCYDDQVQADVAIAASFYDSHQFDEIGYILEPWFRKLLNDPLLVMPKTRVMLFNTLARARVMTGNGEWTSLYRASEAILREVDPLDLARTWNYLAFGLLRNNRLKEAEALLNEIASLEDISDFSRCILRFNQADLYRRLGSLWQNPAMETVSIILKSPGHPFGFYFQATARQPGRTPDDATMRFERARAYFLKGIDRNDARSSILHFLADCMRLGQSGSSNDSAKWMEARGLLARYFDAKPGSHFTHHYSLAWNQLDVSPDPVAANQFLECIPFL